jgi:PAS domain-containing protein
MDSGPELAWFSCGLKHLLLPADTLVNTCGLYNPAGGRQGERKLPANSTGTSATQSAERQAEAFGPIEGPVRPSDLPAGEYALILARRTAPSAILVGDSGNLPVSRDLPLEFFPGAGLMTGERTVPANLEDLARAGLQDVFEPDAAESICSMPISDAPGAAASLLVKASPGSLDGLLREIRANHTAGLQRWASTARSIQVNYEWQILSHIFPCPSPCFVADTGRRLVSSNTAMCDLLGRPSDELVGVTVDSLVYFERRPDAEIPRYPDCVEITSPVLVKPTYRFLTTAVNLTRIPTVCGDRTVYVFRDILSDRRAGNSNVQLVQKLSNLMVSGDAPHTVIRKLINLLALTLNCDLVCVLRRKPNGEMIVTPYCNRQVDTLNANVIESVKEPILEPFFSSGSLVFCENVDKSCPEPSFFRQVSSLSRFALIPIGEGTSSEYAVLAAWSERQASVGSEVIPLLRIIANLVGCALAAVRLETESQQERETLRRYTKLTAGREMRMASLKRENTQLKELVTALSSSAKEQPTQ